MSKDLIRILVLVLDEAILAWIAFRIFRYLRRQPDDTPAAFFAFATVSMIVNNLYWIVFSLMYGDMRMPFSIADFNEDGSLLLTASVLMSIFHEKEKENLWVAMGAVVFAIANTALWICWNGEWAKSILGGLCYAYFAWHTARALWLSKAFSQRDWILWSIGCIALLGGQFLCLVLPAPLLPWMDAGNYALMLAGVVFLSVRTIRAMKAGEGRKKAVSLAVTDCFWQITCVYMCSEPAWFIAEITLMLALTLLLWALEGREGAI